MWLYEHEMYLIRTIMLTIQLNHNHGSFYTVYGLVNQLDVIAMCPILHFG